MRGAMGGLGSSTLILDLGTPTEGVTAFATAYGGAGGTTFGLPGTVGGDGGDAVAVLDITAAAAGTGLVIAQATGGQAGNAGYESETQGGFGTASAFARLTMGAEDAIGSANAIASSGNTCGSCGSAPGSAADAVAEIGGVASGIASAGASSFNENGAVATNGTVSGSGAMRAATQSSVGTGVTAGLFGLTAGTATSKAVLLPTGPDFGTATQTYGYGLFEAAAGGPGGGLTSYSGTATFSFLTTLGEGLYLDFLTSSVAGAFDALSFSLTMGGISISESFTDLAAFQSFFDADHFLANGDGTVQTARVSYSYSSLFAGAGLGFDYRLANGPRVEVNAVPLPGGLWLLLTGLGAVWGLRALRRPRLRAMGA